MDQTILDHTQRQLLSLIRASLWKVPADSDFFRETTADWDGIGRLAEMHTVVPLMVESVLNLPIDIQPSGLWLRRAMTFSEVIRRTHILVDDCVATISGCLMNEHIPNVLLKGQAYARYYPDPAMRQCGDIDLYVGESGYFNAYQISRNAGWDSDEPFIASAKHYGCVLRGVRVEFHRIAAQPAMFRVRRRFMEWSEALLSGSGRRLSIGGAEVVVPPSIFDLVFVFMHLYHHFLNGGIGLRQICDWMMILHSTSGEIDQEELRMLLVDFRLLKAWRCFAPIVVEQLGLPQEECPFYSTKYSGKAGRILSLVMKEGNFGKYSVKRQVRPSGFLRGKLYSLLRQSRKMIFRIPIDPIPVTFLYFKFIKQGVISALVKRVK